MTLPDNNEKEYFWSISIENGWIQAAIWAISEKKVHVTSLGDPIGFNSEDQIIETTDSAISSAMALFPDDLKSPQKTVFGVSSSWIEGGTIKKENLNILRDLCSKLSLTPSGFVVLSESIAHFLKIEEAAPISAILIGVGATNVDISVSKLGNVIGSFEVGRSTSLADDIIEGITRFQTSDNLPSRFILYNGKETELEDLKNELIDADWMGELSTKIKFLHTPKVEIITPKDKMKSICLAGASEIAEVSGVLMEEEKQSKNHLIEEFPIEEKIDESHANVSISEDLKPEDVGFVIDNQLDVNEPVQISVENHNSQRSHKKINLFGFLNILKKIKKPKVTLPVSRLPKSNNKKILLPIFGILGLIVLIFVYWWAVPVAEITLYISPKVLDDRLDLTLDENRSNSDVSKNILAAKTMSTTISGEKSKNATGTKTTGERAKGKVILRNGTSLEVGLKAGTVLTSANNLKFIIDEASTIPEASSPGDPGELTVSVTADSFGPEYNLSKDETLIVSNYPKSELDAVIVDDFSGGSSRQITAVSSSDLKSLEEDLTKELSADAARELSSKSDSSLIIIKDALRTEISSKSFDHQSGDEADTVKLSMEITAIGAAISKDDAKDLYDAILKDRITPGYVLNDENIDAKYTLNSSDEEEKTWNLTLNLKANLIPDLDTEIIKKDLTGLSLEKAQEYLVAVAGYSKAQIRTKKFLPLMPKRMPLREKNIDVTISAEI